MVKFILVVISLYIIISKPIIIVVAGTAYLTWLFLKKPNCFIHLPAYLTTPMKEEGSELENNLPPRKKEYPTAEEVYAKQVDNLMKPGYKNDPKWKEMAEKSRKHNAHQDELSRREERLEELTNEII